MAIENCDLAIECYIKAVLLDDETIPNFNDITFLSNNPDYADGIWETVSMDIAALVREVFPKKLTSYPKETTLEKNSLQRKGDLAFVRTFLQIEKKLCQESFKFTHAVVVIITINIQ